MNNINRLVNYIQKQPQEKLDYTETSATPTPTGGVMTPASVTSADLIPDVPEIDDGGSAIPSHDRLYLVDGMLPGTSKTADALKLKVFKGIEKKDAQFVDKRQIHSRHKNLLNDIHPDTHEDKSFGGIVINQEGKVLLRKPKGTGFGNEWTLAKGGADGGESGSDAALREVLEETGITGKIVKELAGHYNANGKGNKFYLMSVDSSVETKPFKGASEGKEETAEIKWVDLDEAMKLLEKEYEGKNQEAADRDIQAIRQGHREWAGRNKRDITTGLTDHERMVNKAKGMSKDAKELHAVLGDYFAENEGFPEVMYDEDPESDTYGELLQQAMRDDPHYFPLLAEISKETFTPAATTSSSTYTMLKGLMGDFLKKVDSKRGFSGEATFSNLQAAFAVNWGGAAMQYSVHTNIVAHAVAEIRGISESWMFGTAVPVDLDSSGRPVFRTDKLRDEMIKKYDAWVAAGDGEAGSEGFFSNGEKYKFNKFHTVTFKNADKYGEPFEDTLENHWNLVIGRAKAVKAKKEAESFSNAPGKHGQSWRNATKKVYLEYAESYLKSQGKEDVYNALASKTTAVAKNELIEHGKEFVREYVRTAQKITQGLLQAALPKDVHHIYTVRKAGSPREVNGDYGITGSTPAGSNSLPKTSDEKAGGAGHPATIFSAPLSGGSVNPVAWPGHYAIFRRSNIRDIFMIQALWNPGHDGERELVITNNPHSEARIVHTNSDLWEAATWDMAPDRNGMRPENVFGPTEKRLGITNSDTDYQTTLKAATSSDNPLVGEHQGGQLGTNPGKLMKDKTGKQFYIKDSKEDGKNASEDLANKLYEEAGIAVPHTEMVKWGDGTALKSDWIDDTVYHGNPQGTPPPKLANRPEIKHGFFMDCVLANYDVVGGGPEKPHGNLMEKDGKIIRIDQGGALAYKGLDGQKQLKDKNGKVISNENPFWSGHKNLQTDNGFLDEIDNLRDSTINPTTAHVFQGMTEDDWDAAAANLMKLTNSRIEDIVNDSAMKLDKNKMIDTLKARRDAALGWWLAHPEIVGKQGYTSIEDLHAKSNLLKQDFFKAVDKDLEADKNRLVLYLDEEGYNERLTRTEEQQATAEKMFAETNELMKLT